MSSFPLQSSVMSLQHSPAALWARVNMCWSWFPVTHVRIGYLTHKNWLSRQTKQGRELLACPESSPSVWCQLNLLSLMDVLIFKQNGWSCKNWNWNIFVTWLDSFGKEVWNWLLDSEVFASRGEGTMRQTAGQTERQMKKLWSFGPASQNFSLVLFFYKKFFSKNCTSWCFSFVNNTSQQDIPGFHGWMEISMHSAWAEWSRTEIGRNRVIIFLI